VGAAELHGEVEGVLALLVGRVAGEGGAQEGELLTDLGELQVGEGAFEGEGVGLAHGALLWASPALVGGECLDEGLAAPLALLVLEVVGDQGAAQVEALALLGGLEGDGGLVERLEVDEVGALLPLVVAVEVALV